MLPRTATLGKGICGMLRLYFQVSMGLESRGLWPACNVQTSELFHGYFFTFARYLSVCRVSGTP